MIKLSVNINKVATIRNARGGKVPDLIKFAVDCQRFGADGITVHPRPDERHIRYQDVYDLKPVVNTEFNIEGKPSEKFMELVLDVKPDQVTLVPDSDDAITSNAGWDVKANVQFLTEIIRTLKGEGIRTSIFLDPVVERVVDASLTGVDRIELYTEYYAVQYHTDRVQAVKAYTEAAQKGLELGLGINAGHDLDLKNLHYFSCEVPGLMEVSIGHALISDSLYLGIENSIQMYKHELRC
ncbi:MAG: pyridoxine 5'-phosphate synthase [Flavobacteriales bacterium]|nr:pyridoxine 5'-phosphate synthase [Flavobacteriales bacterium]